MRRLSKQESRQRWRELREVVWEWDPIGVSDFPEWPRDEYDCLVGPLMRRLEEGQTAGEIARYLSHEITHHFGLSPEYYDFEKVATEVRRWYDAKWPNTRV